MFFLKKGLRSLRKLFDGDRNKSLLLSGNRLFLLLNLCLKVMSRGRIFRLLSCGERSVIRWPYCAFRAGYFCGIRITFCSACCRVSKIA